MAIEVKSARKLASAGASPRSTGRGGLRDDLKRFTRSRIISAALESFSAIGFKATSVERIVELAGTTAPTFYRHFTSKNDLLRPLQEQLTAEVRVVVDRLDEIEAFEFAPVRAWLNEFITMWERAHRLCTAYWEAIEFDAELAAEVMPAALATVGRLERLLGRCPPEQRESAQLRLALMIPMLDRVILVARGTREPQLRDRLLDEFAHMLVCGIGDAFKPRA